MGSNPTLSARRDEERQKKYFGQITKLSSIEDGLIWQDEVLLHDFAVCVETPNKCDVATISKLGDKRYNDKQELIKEGKQIQKELDGK